MLGDTGESARGPLHHLKRREVRVFCAVCLVSQRKRAAKWDRKRLWMLSCGWNAVSRHAQCALYPPR